MKKPLRYHVMSLKAHDDQYGDTNKVLNSMLKEGWVVEQMTALPLVTLDGGRTLGEQYIKYLLAYYGKESE